MPLYITDLLYSPPISKNMYVVKQEETKQDRQWLYNVNKRRVRVIIFAVENQ
jgi:hypothetical protein